MSDKELKPKRFIGRYAIYEKQNRFYIYVLTKFKSKEYRFEPLNTAMAFKTEQEAVHHADSLEEVLKNKDTK